MIGSDQGGELLRLVLAVGVHRDDDVGAELQGDVVADAEREAAAPADRQARRERARRTRGVRRAVVRVVVDHDRDDMVAVDLPGHGLDDGSHVLGLVERWGHDDDPLAGREVGGCLPVEGRLTERLDELPDPTLVRVHLGLHADQEEEQHADGEQQDGRETLPTPRLEVEDLEQRVEQPGDDREQQEGDRDQRRDDQVQPADLTSAVADQGEREERCGEDASDHAQCRHGSDSTRWNGPARASAGTDTSGR